MKLSLFLITFFLSFSAFAKGSMCMSLFEKFELQPDKYLSYDGKKEAVVSDDGRFIKIVNLKTNSQYTYDSRDPVRGFFSLNSRAWIIPHYNEVQIWNFDREAGNLIRVELKNPVRMPRVSMHKDSSGETFLKIVYLRKKINPDTRQYFETYETIVKSLETFIETRF